MRLLTERSLFCPTANNASPALRFVLLLLNLPASVLLVRNRVSRYRSVYPRVLIGLGLAQLTLAGYVILQQGYYQGILTLPLPGFIYWYGFRSYKR